MANDYISKLNSLSPQQRATREKLLPYIKQVANANGLDYRMLDAIYLRESGYNVNAVGSKTKYGRAKGIAQMLPSTAKSYGLKVSGDNDERLNPYKSIEASAKYISSYAKRTGGDWGQVGRGYFSGPSKVGSIPNSKKEPEAVKYYSYMKKAQQQILGGQYYPIDNSVITNASIGSPKQTSTRNSNNEPTNNNVGQFDLFNYIYGANKNEKIKQGALNNYLMANVLFDNPYIINPLNNKKSVFDIENEYERLTRMGV